MAEPAEAQPAPSEPASEFRAERLIKRSTAILSGLAALVGAIYGVGAAVSKFADSDSFARRLLDLSAKPGEVATPIGSAFTPSANCASWQQSVAATFDREYQNHQGSGYTVALQRRFASITQAQEVAAALSDEVWGRPVFPVAVEERSGKFLVGIGFNLTRQKASDLLGRMTACYGEKVELLEPGIALHTPRKVVRS